MLRDFRSTVLLSPPRFTQFARLISLLLCGAALAHAAELPVGFVETQVATGLNPVSMGFSPDGRLFLCEKHGHLRIIAGDELLDEPALDISTQVDSWNERGLLSICFDPDFSKNGWLYLYYTHDRNSKDHNHTSSNNRVSRFTIKGNTVDPRSEKVLLELNDLSKIGWHNGGGLAFGNDRKLYVSTGENANSANAQDPTNLLGKLLRINPDGSIPKDNPHYQEFKGQNRAIVALGLRNGFSITVQPSSGLLYLSDVGANYEQIEQYNTASQPVAANFGWPEIDGPAGDKKTPKNYRAAAYPYDHGKGQGVALCGGDFYQPNRSGPQAFPSTFQGKFFFGDYGGWIKYIDPARPEKCEDFAKGINRALDVAIAGDGALWYIERNGKEGGSDEANSSSKNGMLWRVSWSGGRGDIESNTKSAGATLPKNIRLPSSAEQALPEKLSAIGIFTDKKLSVIANAVPYTLSGSIWADGATIRRWFILPEIGKIGFSEKGDYTWPGGTVFVQHFELGARRLETRLLVLDQTGSFGYGASYRWRADGTDADLVAPQGAEETLKPSGQTWTYPASALCFLCHTPNASFVLGPRTHQLSTEQLLRWNKAGYFSKPLDEKAVTQYRRSCKIDDLSAPLETRIRSYLAGNCSHCHRPGGTGAEWDARFSSFSGIINGQARNDLDIPGAKLIVPGDAAKSLLLHRMLSTDPVLRMPPATRNVTDSVATEVFKKWIKSL